jgi:NAD(P)-dependent dehydrogenase (short-subunit alcohol dehydrogenase family)
MQISDVAAVVSGGASGLGAATAAALAQRGATVYGLDLAASIERAGDPPTGVRLIAADVTDPEQVGAAVDTAAGGGVPLRIAVNCAGIGSASRVVGRAGPHDLDAFRRTVEVNLIGTFNVLRLAAAAMAATEPVAEAGGAVTGQRGVIVNTASIAAFDGQIGQAAYAASKGGVASMTLPIARDLASHGIRVLTIAPGIVDTPMLGTLTEEIRGGLAAGVPFPKRLGRPDDYALLVTQLVENDYLNGEVIRMDGALRMAPR